MPRTSIRMTPWIACLLLAVAALWAEAAGLGETLLPGTTKGFVSIADIHDLSDHWNQTQVGQLMNDPVMEPFVKDLRRQLEDRWSGFRERLGLTMEDLRGVAGGELSVAVVMPGPQQRALVLLVDVSEHQEEAKALLEKVTANLIAQGASRSDEAFSGTDVVVLDLPEDEEAEEDAPREQAIYFLKDDLLGASDDKGVMEEVLARLGGEGEDPLAEQEAFKAVMERCAEDAGEREPQVRWFIDPLGYAEAMRAAAPLRSRRRGKSVLDVLKEQGFSAIQGVGGFVDLAVDDFELMHRTVVFAPPPHEKSMKMMVFPNSEEFAPESWVPRKIATYATFYGDVMNAFDNFGSLFDELYGEAGESDLWEDVLEGLKTQPDGPKIDLRGELFAHLDNRVTIIADYELPITTSSERLLFAVKTKDETAVAAAIEKAMKNDEGKEVQRRNFEEHVIWETIPPEEVEVPLITIGPLPPLFGEDEEDEGIDVMEDVEEETQPLLPTAAVTVARGYLMVASHYDYLVSILEQREERETLARDVDYLVVAGTMSEALAAGANCVRTFSRTEEEYRATYELIRQGKMPESETMLGRILNSVLGEGDRELRTQRIDGSQLPEYDYVRRYLGPAGMFGTSEETGWFFKGFMLARESP